MNTRDQDYVYDFDRPENKLAFEAKRAHVICCAWGGYGVLEFVGFGVGAAKGIKRHGYELGRNGKMTRAEATATADGLNYAETEHLRAKLREKIYAAYPAMADYVTKNGKQSSTRPHAG